LADLTSIGYADNESANCVYYRHGGGKGVIHCLYVDDILTIRSYLILVYLNVFKWIGGDYPKSPKKSSLISLFAKEYLNGITSR
jgi:hypothetical protein